MSNIAHRPFAERFSPAPIISGLQQDGWWTWCGSSIRDDDGRYHLFAARWPQNLKFLPGYQCASEIVRAISDTPQGPYRFVEVVLGDRGPGFWDGRMTHNPVVVRRNGRFLLFYIGTTYVRSRPTAQEVLNGPDFWPWYRQIRIGVAWSDRLEGPWRRPDRPLLEPRPGGWDAHVVTNPSPCLTPDGRLLLYYRTWIPEVGCRLGLAEYGDLDRPPLWRSTEPLFNGSDLNLEDPCVFYLDDHYEMIAKDLNGLTCGELHAGIHLLSPDGRAWQVASHPKAWTRSITWDDGVPRRLAHFERPQVLLEAGQPAWIFAAMAEGEDGPKGNFSLLKRTWTGVVPLR